MRTPKVPGAMISKMNAMKGEGKMMKHEKKAKHMKHEKHEKVACKTCAKHKKHMKTEHKHK